MNAVTYCPVGYLALAYFAATTELGEEGGRTWRYYLMVAWKQIGFRVSQFLSPKAMEHGEFMSSLLALVWGGWLLMPWNALESPSRVFGGLLNAMPENYWGALMVTAGLSQFYAVIEEKWKWRIANGLCLSVCWAIVAWSFWVNAPATLGGPVYSCFSLASVVGSVALSRRGQVFWPFSPSRSDMSFAWQSSIATSETDHPKQSTDSYRKTNG